MHVNLLLVVLHGWQFVGWCYVCTPMYLVGGYRYPYLV